MLPTRQSSRSSSGLSIERANIAINAAHTSPKGVDKVFGLVKPRMAGLWLTMISPQITPMIFAELDTIYDGPVVQTQDLTLFNITKESVVARQKKQFDKLPLIPGKMRGPTHL
jgi:ribonuclease Z